MLYDVVCCSEMQHPWRNFATDYAEKGMHQSSSMYPHSPVSMSHPSYNRSPAPFNPTSYQSTPASQSSQYHSVSTPNFNPHQSVSSFNQHKSVSSFNPHQSVSSFNPHQSASSFIPHQSMTASDSAQYQTAPAMNFTPQQPTSAANFTQQTEQANDEYQYDQNQSFEHHEPVYQQPTRKWPPQNAHQESVRQHHQFSEGQMHELPQKPVKNIREDPDVEENFPSFKELRKVFVEKQNTSNHEDRRPNTRHRRQTNKTLVVSKPPSPQVTKKPPLSSPQNSRDVTDHQSAFRPAPMRQSQATHNVNAAAASPRKPRRIFSQLSHQGEPLLIESEQQPSVMKSPTRRRSQSLSQAHGRERTINRYQEVPVHNTNNDPTDPWQHIKPTRDAVRHKPPMSIQIPSYNDGSPKVVITSNSPRSPQKATYVPEGTDQTFYPRPISVTHNAPATVLAMSHNDNKPRRRRSYAEIMITHNSLPRNFKATPSISQSHEDVWMNGENDDKELFPRQQRYNTVSRFGRSRSVHHNSSSNMGNTNPRHPTMDQMLYAPSTPSPQSECLSNYVALTLMSPIFM